MGRAAWVLFMLVAAGAQERPEIVVQGGHGDEVTCVAYSRDGQYLSSGDDAGTIVVWDLPTGVARLRLASRYGRVAGLAWSPDGRSLASAHFFGEVVVWDAVVGQARHRLSPGGQFTAPAALQFSGDGRQLSVCDQVGGIHVWETATGRVVRTLRATRPVHAPAAAVSPDGRLFASTVPGTPEVVLKETASGKGRARLRLKQRAVALNFSPDGRLLATYCGDRLITIFDVATAKPRLTIKEVRYADHLVFSSDGRYLAGGNNIGMVVWELPGGQRVSAVETPRFNHHNLAFTPDGRTVAAPVGNGVGCWDTATGVLARSFRGQRSTYPRLVLSPDGLTLASSAEGRTVVWDTRVPQPRHLLDRGFGVVFTPDSRHLICGSKGGAVMYDLADGHERRRFAADNTELFGVLARDQAGLRLAGWGGNKLCLWDMITGQLSWSIAIERDAVNHLEFSPDGLLLAAGQSGPLTVRDTRSGATVRALPESDGYRPVGFSADGRQLASQLYADLRLWDVATGQQVPKERAEIVEIAARSSDQPRSESCTLMTRDRMLSIVPGSDGSVAFQDSRTGKPLVTVYTFDRGANWLAVTADGYYTGSPAGAELVRWQIGGEFFPASRFEEQFKRPDIVARAMRGQAAGDIPVLTTALRPPHAQILTPQDGGAAEGERLEVEVLGTGDRPLQSVALYLNGRPAPAEAMRAMTSRDFDVTAASERPKQSRAFRLMVPLPPGEARVKLTAVVYDDQKLASNPAEATVLPRQPAAAGSGALHVLAVGVSEYQKASSLAYAHADARAFAALLAEQAGRLYQDVRVTELLSSQATRDAVRRALSELMEQARLEDTVMLFFAGHGVRDEQYTYYFATTEADPADLAATCLPMTVFETALAGLRAKRVYAFLDTCHSGGVLGEQRAATERWAEGLMKKAGVVVLSSSTGEEASLENGEWQHGAFTLALLEGLRGAADKLPEDGAVALSELVAYVAGRVSQLTEQRQNPRIPWQRDVDPNVRLTQVK